MAGNVEGPHFEFAGQKFDVFSMLGLGQKQAERKPEADIEVEEDEDAGELYIITRDFFTVDLDNLTEKYPCISAVASFACGFFALMYVFSFSPSNILVGGFLGVFSFALGKSLFKMDNLVRKVWAGAMNMMQVPEPADDDVETEKAVKVKGKKV